MATAAASSIRVAWGVGLGLAVGVIPLPTQMLLAAAVAILFRANVAAAIAATWLTNPFTLVPIWSLAIWLGGLLVHEASPVHAPPMLSLDWQHPAGWISDLGLWLASLGKPLLVGLPLAGLLLGALAYLAVYLGWWAVIMFERGRRLRERARRAL